MFRRTSPLRLAFRARPGRSRGSAGFSRQVEHRCVHRRSHGDGAARSLHRRQLLFVDALPEIGK